MLDLKFIQENSEIVKKNIKNKFQNEKLVLVDEIISKYNQWKDVKKEIDNLRAKRNKLSEEINKTKKEKKDFNTLLKNAQEIPGLIKELEDKSNALQERINKIQLIIPNIMHTSVPLGKDASQNKVLYKKGNIVKFKFKPKTHVELIEFLDIGDFDASARVSGKGFYYLKKELALLNQALRNPFNVK